MPPVTAKTCLSFINFISVYSVRVLRTVLCLSTCLYCNFLFVLFTIDLMIYNTFIAIL